MCNCKTFLDYIPDAVAKFALVMMILSLVIAFVAAIVDSKKTKPHTTNGTE
jgi:hypothetical protein